MVVRFAAAGVIAIVCFSACSGSKSATIENIRTAKAAIFDACDIDAKNPGLHYYDTNGDWLVYRPIAAGISETGGKVSADHEFLYNVRTHEIDERGVPGEGTYCQR